MIFDKITILRQLSPNWRAGQRLAMRWMAAAEREPELVNDVIRMGGILAQRPKTFADGVEVLDPIDPIRLAVDRGRAELAQDLLALMNINPFELQQIMETNNDTD